MSLKDLLAKAKESSPKKFDRASSSEGNGVEMIFMNAPVNQGTLKFFPIPSEDGEVIKFVYDVSQFQVYRKNEETGDLSWRWGKVLQTKDYVSELNQDQKDKIEACHSKIYHLQELGYGKDWAKVSNYALMFGYILEHTNKDGEKLVTGGNPKLALLVMPSKRVASALTTLGEGIATSSGAEQIYQALFNRNAEDRNVYMELVFKQGEGFGYDVVMAFKTFDVFSSGDLLPKDQANEQKGKIPAELIDKCKAQTAIFLGNRETKEDYIPEHIDQLLTQLDAEIRKTEVQNKLPEVPSMPGGVDPNVPTGEGWK